MQGNQSCIVALLKVVVLFNQVTPVLQHLVGNLSQPPPDSFLDFSESLTKTAITKEITADSGKPMEASAVAAAALAGLKRGDFMVSANFTGFMLCVNTVGMAPPSSFLSSTLEVLLAGLMRIVAIAFLSDFHAIIKKHYRKTS